MKIILIGPPGAGKGTVSNFIIEKYNIPSISTGDIFRDEIRKETELGKLAASLINQGNFIPDDIVVNIIQNTLKTMDDYILDGFPRNIAQGKIFDELIQESNTEIDAVIHLNTSDEMIIERLEHRRICKACQSTYHLLNKPPLKEGVCDKCSSPLYQRPDDNPKLVKKRLEIYHQETEPLVAFYQAKGLVFNLNTMCSIEEMLQDISDIMELVNRYKK